MQRPPEELRPVTEYENDSVQGAALAAKKIFDEEQEKVAKLRKQHQDYKESLPKDPIQALKEISRTLPHMNESLSDQYALKAALILVNELALRRDLDNCQDLNDAIFWLTSQGINALRMLEESNARAHDIAGQFHDTHRPFRA